MPQPSKTTVNLDVSLGTQRSSSPVEPDTPFRILILGDFTGRANRKVHAPLSDRRPMLVDRDNIDDLIGTLRPALSIRGVNLEFREIDDFHPDRLYERVPLLRQIAEERHKPLAAAAAPAPVTAAAAPAGGLLDQLLDDVEERPAPAPAEAGDLAAFISRVIANDLVPREDPRKKAQESRADALAGIAMRAVLHHPDFQAAEAAWRAVEMLVRRLETGEELKLYLFDATADELTADSGGTQRLFADPDKEWALIAGNYTFGETVEDAARLNFFGALAEHSGAPFLAEAAAPSASGRPPEWDALRHSSRARWIGLALPRFLLRLPYGPDTSPIESFGFEEMPVSNHQDYLWGNPAFACVCLLAQTFTEDRWEMRPGKHRGLSGLPVHAYKQDGETQLKPCAEVLMTEKEAEILMEQGIMPLASMKRQDTALLVRFQSIADPVAALAGRWTA